MRPRVWPVSLLLIACGPEAAGPVTPASNVTPAPIASVRPPAIAMPVAAKDAGPIAVDTNALAEAVHGESADAARDAAIALGRSSAPESRTALVDALALCDKERRQIVLEALRDKVGAPALVPLLSVKPAADANPDRVKFQTRQVMDMLASLADPRGADALVAYIATEPPPHWKTEAAFRLAEVGDLRAAPVLAWRLAQDPLRLYDDSTNPEYRRDDNERVRAARLLADLATMYPASHADLRAAAESQTLAWLVDRPQPHANGIRFLATAESTALLPKLRAWAEPKEPLPKPGQTSFSPDFATAQVALRYLGRTGAPKAFETLEKQLHRRPAKTDATMDSLMSGGMAVQGMALRALGTGAAQGLAELGDPRGTPLLLAYIEDMLENEQARLEACFSLGVLASDATLLDVAKRAGTFAKGNDKQRLVASCYLETLQRRTTTEASRLLVSTFLTASADAALRTSAARAIGLGGVPSADQPVLLAMLKDARVANDAALALLLGGTPDAAMKSVAPHAGDPEALKMLYSQSFGVFTDRAWADGHIARMVHDADACRNDPWPAAVLSRALSGIDYDSGPHSLTRPVFRHLLVLDAKAAAEPRRTDARRILQMLGENGVLMSLP